MKRNIDTKLDQWIKESDKAVLIYGARQVGKTYSIREALKRNCCEYFEVNFFENQDFLEAMKKCTTASDIIATIELLSSKQLMKHKSIIFFDEVQLYPEIVTKIKFLVDDGSYRFILSGSMLGVELNSLKSMPVGYVEMLKMFPMDLYEFSLALSVKQKTWDYLYSCYQKKEIVNDVIHKDMMRVFNYYLICGGMPDCVKTFVEKKNLNLLYELQLNIINQYKEDFSKYETKDKKLKLIAIYDNISSQLNKHDTRFIFTYLNKQLKFDRYENSFLWLKDAGVAYPVYISNQIESPLEMFKEKNTFKLFFSDVGLLTSCFPLSERRMIILMEDLYNIHKGSLYENFVSQELFAHGLNPYYYKSKKIGEIDFLAELENEILAIEVKSGKDYTKHRALNHLKEENLKNIKYVLLSNYNIKEKDGIINYPIYMVDFIKDGILENPNIKIDIGSL